MPNVPDCFNGGHGVPSIDHRTTSGNGSSKPNDKATTGKPWPDLKDAVSTGGKKQGKI